MKWPSLPSSQGRRWEYKQSGLCWKKHTSNLLSSRPSLSNSTDRGIHKNQRFKHSFGTGGQPQIECWGAMSWTKSPGRRHCTHTCARAHTRLMPTVLHTAFPSRKAASRWQVKESSLAHDGWTVGAEPGLSSFTPLWVSMPHIQGSRGFRGSS